MSNIDEKAKNNLTIEMRIFENYEKVKHEIIKVIDFLRHAETNLGMCKIFDNQNHEFWHSVIKPWFQPEMQSKIHDIQRMIISRPGFRMNKEKFRDYGEG